MEPFTICGLLCASESEGFPDRTHYSPCSPRHCQSLQSLLHPSAQQHPVPSALLRHQSHFQACFPEGTDRHQSERARGWPAPWNSGRRGCAAECRGNSRYLLIRRGDIDHLIQSSRPQQGLIQDVRPIGCHNDHDVPMKKLLVFCGKAYNTESRQQTATHENAFK